jgi:uncharacterized protein (DUF2164 family)
MTEIEIRGKLSKDKFDEQLKLLTENGELADHYHRLSLDLSPGFDPATKTWKNSSGTDIRLKKSDEKEKLSIKMGNFHEKERKEVEVKLQTGQFLSALDFLEALGYNSGMIYYWQSWEFNYKGVEIKLSKYTDEYFTFEIEGKQNSDVDAIAKDFELTSYSQEQYRKVIDWENQNIHRPYTRELTENLLKSEF